VTPSALRSSATLRLKSHPYRDVEVLEWFERVESAKALEAMAGTARCDLAARLVTRYSDHAPRHLRSRRRRVPGIEAHLRLYADRHHAVEDLQPADP
jgi:hypothetical protein